MKDKLMKEFFSPNDFKQLSHYDGSCSTFYAATVANDLFNKLIESWPVVYGWKYSASDKWAFDQEKFDKTTTHQCRLAFIEEIPKEPCKHEPEINLGENGVRVSFPEPGHPNISRVIFLQIKCKYCGIELQAQWEAKESNFR